MLIFLLNELFGNLGSQKLNCFKSDYHWFGLGFFNLTVDKKMFA